mmetsp:Transcript_1037/g.2171  ORF Transcript_1037/g.2171 Transcript_1037/m.2171 type:complete len:159 (+) Transcript_1037:51-527(+)
MYTGPLAYPIPLSPGAVMAGLPTNSTGTGESEPVSSPYAYGATGTDPPFLIEVESSRSTATTSESASSSGGSGVNGVLIIWIVLLILIITVINLIVVDKRRSNRKEQLRQQQQQDVLETVAVQTPARCNWAAIATISLGSCMGLGLSIFSLVMPILGS